MDVEFSRRIEVDKITGAAWMDSFSATEKECAALAKRFGIESLANLKATVTLQRVSDDKIIMAEGRFDVDVVQRCVVSLEPVKSHIAAEFTETYTENNLRFLPGAEIAVSPADEESPEPIENGIIDMGEMIAQQLSLELDPYPRSPKVKEIQDAEIVHKSGDDLSPFAILAKLKKNKDG